MPCTYFDPPGTFCNEEKVALTAKLGKYKSELDQATKLLCNLCANLEKMRNEHSQPGIIIEDVPGLEVWWKAHKKMDVAKVRADKKLMLETVIWNLERTVKEIKGLGGVPGRSLTENLAKQKKNLAAFLKAK
jgi:hypothetical protein